jgi:uncharacterized glyoxalase superfamily protein PhnB
MSTLTLQARGLVPTLTASDLKRSLRFYTEGLGFEITEKMEESGELRGVMLRAGGALMGISQDNFAKGRERIKGVGMRLYLETEQDIKTLAARAASAGITLDEGPGPLPMGPVGFTVTDPDGFRLTISNPF